MLRHATGYKLANDGQERAGMGVGGVGDAGKTEGQPHASPAELATDTLGQSVWLVSEANAPDIHTSISGYATKIIVKATDDELILPRSGN